MKTKEPPSTERYARWCERSANHQMVSLLLDYFQKIHKIEVKWVVLMIDGYKWGTSRLQVGYTVSTAWQQCHHKRNDGIMY